MESESIGEKRVRIKFNPSSSSAVDQIKMQTAELINAVEDMKDLDLRLAYLAQTAYEEAAMWAVKLATTQK